LSIRLLLAWKIQSHKQQWPIIQTAVDDLESFHWILIWAIAHILKDQKKATGYDPEIDMILDIFLGDMDSQAYKESIVHTWWNSTVFGGLFKEWMDIFQQARQDLPTFSQNFFKVSSDSQKQEEACNELESYCMTTYKNVLESGFRHLKQVREYPNWDKVVL
jgi:hypothetical protein